MSRKYFLTFCIVIVAVFSLGYLFFPSKALALLGFRTDPTGLLITQFIGVLSLGYVAILWKLKDSELEDQKPVLMGVATAMGFAFTVSLYHQIGGSFGNLGWIGVTMFGTALVIFGYLSFKS